MGNQQTNPNDPHYYDDLNVAKYKAMRPSLSETEIKQIYRMFQGYNPKDGKIESEELLKKYKGGPECEDLQRSGNQKFSSTKIHRLRPIFRVHG